LSLTEKRGGDLAFFMLKRSRKDLVSRSRTRARIAMSNGTNHQHPNVLKSWSLPISIVVQFDLPEEPRILDLEPRSFSSDLPGPNVLIDFCPGLLDRVVPHPRENKLKITVDLFGGVI